MNGYSKIRVNSSPASKPRSIEGSSDLTSPSPPKAHGDPGTTSKARQGQAGSKICGQILCREEREEDGSGERFGVVLSRTCSSASERFRASERSHGGLQDVVMRAFSMRKASSVAEGYWRFHGTGDGGDEDLMVQQQQQQVRSSRKKRGRIFRACKRLFRF